MRYLYQQLLAFCGMVALILLIVGVSFTQLTKQTIEENNYQQLFGYAESVEKTTQTYADTLPQFSQDQAFQNALLLTEQVLTEQNVNFIFIDKNERVIYPTNTALLNFTLTADQWKNLRNGRQEKFTSNKNILGQAQATSYALVPFNLNHEFYGALVVSQPARNIDNSVRPITLNLFKGFIFSSIVAVIASYAFAAFQVKRINRLRNATKEVTNGNFDVQLPVHDKDEFDELADDFNKMTNSLKESQAEIEEQENRRRQFMADASHEMRTPLTTINGLLEGLEYNAIPENQRENAIKLMKNETERLIRLVNENLDYEKIRTNQISMVIKKFNGTDLLVPLFSLSYALMGYTIVYQLNLMWLDGIIFLPLIAYGLEKLMTEKRGWIYSVFLGLALFSNYYIGYMICFFLPFFFIARLLSNNHLAARKSKEFLKLAGLFMLHSLIAAGLAAFLLLPTFFTLLESKAGYMSNDFQFKWAYPMQEILSKLVIGAFNFDQMPSGLPSVFVGTTALVSFICYFFNNRFSISERLYAGLLTAFLLVSMNLEALNKVWHAFQFPVWFPYRFAFLFGFFVILTGYRAF